LKRASEKGKCVEENGAGKKSFFFLKQKRNSLVHFVVIWYIFPVLASCAEKNLASLQLPRFSMSATSRRRGKKPRKLPEKM
jgi:hypothetical protein